jgi:hypothetical protein
MNWLLNTSSPRKNCIYAIGTYHRAIAHRDGGGGTIGLIHTWDDNSSIILGLVRVSPCVHIINSWTQQTRDRNRYVIDDVLRSIPFALSTFRLFSWVHYMFNYYFRALCTSTVRLTNVWQKPQNRLRQDNTSL